MGDRKYGNRKRKLILRGHIGRCWISQKASIYPPIHDQIDTPTDFSMAVWKGWHRRDGSRSQREAEQRRAKRAPAKQWKCHKHHDNKVQETTTRIVRMWMLYITFNTPRTQWQTRNGNSGYKGHLARCVSEIIKNIEGRKETNVPTSCSAKVIRFNMYI